MQQNKMKRIVQYLAPDHPFLPWHQAMRIDTHLIFWLEFIRLSQQNLYSLRFYLLIHLMQSRNLTFPESSIATTAFRWSCKDIERPQITISWKKSYFMHIVWIISKYSTTSFDFLMYSLLNPPVESIQNVSIDLSTIHENCLQNDASFQERDINTPVKR